MIEIKTTSVWFPKHGNSLEFEVEYHQDNAYVKVISIESIKLHGVEMADYFNEDAIDEFEDLVLEKLK